MRGWPLAAATLSVGVALAGCGGGGGTVSSASLRPRLLPASALPRITLERHLDWSDPVNLVGEGIFLPETTRPSDAVKEFSDAQLKGAAGEVLTTGSGIDATEVRLGVAKLGSASDANRVRDWMHGQDLQEPCFGVCTFTTRAVSVVGIPRLRLVVQSSHPPKAARASAGARPPSAAPANYLAEFTIGPYLYWAVLHADASARAPFDAGLKRFYAHARGAS